MRVLFLGLNYDPEPIGIAVYSGGLCRRLAELGHEVTAIVGKPYYPQWQILPTYEGHLPVAMEGGVRVKRVGFYVPRRPTGLRRVLHHISFAISVLVPVISRALWHRPDLVVTVAPSLASAPVALLAARLSGARSWLHVQDLEIEAAIGLGLLPRQSLVTRLAGWVERCVLNGFDNVSSISETMCRAIDRSRPKNRPSYLFRNWATAGEEPFDYRAAWQIDRPYVALYSGNIANKQGIDIVIEAARRLRGRDDLLFLICGEGPNLAALRDAAADLGNIRFAPLQPFEQLTALMRTATLHLLPQHAGAADLVLPSKLTNMLASGRAIVATAAPGTSLAQEMEDCGIVTPPGDPIAFAEAIARLVDDAALRDRYAGNALERAESRWNRIAVLDPVIARMAGRADLCGNAVSA